MITAQELGLVEAGLKKAVASDVDVLALASGHIIGSGGKRLRPRLVLLSYKAAGGKDVAAVVPVAVAVELLHTASLVHDDINDNSDLRRGRPSVNARWGNSLALLVGDFVFVRLLDLIAGYDTRVIRVMADCCRAIIEGETLQMIHLGNWQLSEETYLRIVELKTARLFAACCELGGLIAGASSGCVTALRECGRSLGMAFQIRDDVLDVIGDEGDLGKPVTSDLMQGKISLATIHARQQTREAGNAQAYGDLSSEMDLLRKTGALEYATQKAKEYAAEAQRSLAAVPESVMRHELFELADFAAARIS
jgi:geranylgeranyl pyrophosphate synthase